MLGPYRILDKLGEGGMGQVFKALDTRLDRIVAVKVLPPDVRADAERRARFEREARTIAGLNHPHICVLHNVGDDRSTGSGQPTLYLVMEFLEGQTLAARLGTGPLPLQEALSVATEIADALSAAHRQGIIHRDLKPANVMLTKAGAKLLDFGLARAATGGVPGAATTALPTEPDATIPGAILGTLPYMAPEQLEGRGLDTRADIFSFGAVLYEMLSGRRAFSASNQAGVIAAIMSSQPPPLSSIAPSVPPELERLVRRCLEKQPDERWESAHDIAVELRGISEDMTGRSRTPEWRPVEKTRGATRATRWAWALVAGAATALALLAALWTWLPGREAAPEGAAAASVPVVTTPGTLGAPSFSPDGGRIAFPWNGPQQDNVDIYVRLIAGGEPQRLTSDPATDFSPAWSPDGNLIAFIRTPAKEQNYAWSAAIYVVPAVGGRERRVASVRVPGLPLALNLNPAGLAWSPDGRSLLTTDQTPTGLFALYMVPLDGGNKRQITRPPPSARLFGDAAGSFSPDGESIVFVRMHDLGDHDLYRVRLRHDNTSANESERLTEEQRQIFSPVWSGDGRHVFYSSGNYWTSGRTIRRLDLSAPRGSRGYPSTQETFGEDAFQLAITANGRRVSYQRQYTDSNIYRVALPGGSNATAEAPRRWIASTRNDLLPAISPDGKSIAFTSSRSGSQQIWVCDADGGNPRQLTFMEHPLVSNPQWSPDGRTLVFQSKKKTSQGLYLIDAEGGTPRPLTGSDEQEVEARWSRDGKFIYFHSERTGRFEIYRVAVSGGSPTQITKSGGGTPFESVDGKWLYYYNYSKGGAIWRVPPGGGVESEFHPGPVASSGWNFFVVEHGIYFARPDQTLAFVDFRTGHTRTISRMDKPWAYGLAVSPDGRWALCALEEEGVREVVLVDNVPFAANAAQR